ncbi:MAG: hypothetical protein MJ063_00755 [Lachnospiraceae bacterium]|nr:hypothetical protein [Lachnospiraceae bacterium]
MKFRMVESIFSEPKEEKTKSFMLTVDENNRIVEVCPIGEEPPEHYAYLLGTKLGETAKRKEMVAISSLKKECTLPEGKL